MARTPRQLGVNVEIQDHHREANWPDWIADCGATAIRTFHPERHLRKTDRLAASRWGTMATRADFEAFRSSVQRDPQSSPIAWHDYAFAEPVPWMGIPDGFVAVYRQLGKHVLYSLGYLPTLYAQPLLHDVGTEQMPIEAAFDTAVDWGAVASAYEYYAAVIHHFATDFGGTHFMMCNEPENRFGGWHLPEDLAGKGWGVLFWDDDDPGWARRYLRVLSVQYAVLCRIARWALEDVRARLPDPRQASDLRLTGPATVVWDGLWGDAEPYLDALDYHHYHTDHRTFQHLHRSAAALANQTHKPTMCSEFNRLSGGTPIAEFLFDLDRALEQARLVMTMLAADAPTGPGIDQLCLYLLGFPSTHRNYKHLVYGDTNLMDWEARDQPLWNRDPAWYPTFDELQLRHPTPAYHAFRLLARAADSPQAAVLDWGLVNPTSSGPADIHDQLECLIVRQPERVVVTILNASDRPAPRTTLDWSRLALPDGCWVVQRVVAHRQADEVAAVSALAPDGMLTVDIPARALVQWLVVPSNLGAITSLSLRERSLTPGGIDGLGLLQTTRLEAIDDQGVECGNLNVAWSSSHPTVVRVGQGGLVQRLRSSSDPVTITAVAVPSGATASVTIPGDRDGQARAT